MAKQYVDPAVKAQQATVHDVCVMGRHVMYYIMIKLYYIILHYITLYYIILHYITLYYIILHYITLYYIILHYIILNYIIVNMISDT